MQKFRLYSGADSRFFKALLNLIGSLRSSNKDTYELIIYDLGMKKKELKILNDFYDVIEIRKLKTNTEIYKNPYCAKCLIFFEMMQDSGKSGWLDSGLIIENSLEEVYDLIKTNPILTLPGTFTMRYNLPISFKDKYNLDESVYSRCEIGAGFVFFNFNETLAKSIVNHVKFMSDNSECAGWSKSELSRSYGLLKSDIIREDCPMFRHDSTVLGVAIYKFIPEYKPLMDMYKYNHAYKYEYSDQVVFTSRKKNRIYYIDKLFNTKNKFLNINLLLKNFIVYSYLTLKRNLEFYQDSLLLKYIKKKYKNFALYNTLDKKFRSMKFNNIIFNKPYDKRVLMFDTFKVFRKLDYISETPAIKIESIKKDILIINIFEISYDLLKNLIQSNQSFYLRYKFYKKDLEKPLKELIHNSFELFNIYDKNMLNIQKVYDENEVFDDHKDFLYYHPAFHKYEYVELFFEVKNES